MKVDDRVLVRGTHPGTVKNVAADGDPYVRLDQGTAAAFPVADVRPAA